MDKTSELIASNEVNILVEYINLTAVLTDENDIIKIRLINMLCYALITAYCNNNPKSVDISLKYYKCIAANKTTILSDLFRTVTAFKFGIHTDQLTKHCNPQKHVSFLLQSH